MRKLFLNFWKSFSCPPQNELSVMGKSLSYKLFRFGYRLKCNIKFFLDPLWIDLKERKLTNNASKRSAVQVKDFYASSIKNWILPWEYFFPHVSIRKERKKERKKISSRVWTENYWQRIISLSSSQWFLFVVDILIKNAWALDSF